MNKFGKHLVLYTDSREIVGRKHRNNSIDFLVKIQELKSQRNPDWMRETAISLGNSDLEDATYEKIIKELKDEMAYIEKNHLGCLPPLRSSAPDLVSLILSSINEDVDLKMTRGETRSLEYCIQILTRRRKHFRYPQPFQVLKSMAKNAHDCISVKQCDMDKEHGLLCDYLLVEEGGGGRRPLLAWELKRSFMTLNDSWNKGFYDIEEQYRACLRRGIHFTFLVSRPSSDNYWQESFMDDHGKSLGEYTRYRNQFKIRFKHGFKWEEVKMPPHIYRAPASIYDKGDLQEQLQRIGHQILSRARKVLSNL